MKQVFILVSLVMSQTFGEAIANNYSDCLIDYSGQYYISKDNLKISDFVSSLESAISLRQSLIISGVCELTHKLPARCNVAVSYDKQNNGGYYIFRYGGPKMPTELFKSPESLMRAVGSLVASGNCAPQTLPFTEVCYSTFYSDFDYVKREGTVFSATISEDGRYQNRKQFLGYTTAKQLSDDLIKAGACRH